MNDNKVYCWTNKINNKKYFGRTNQEMNKRKNSKSMSGYKDSKRFWNAIQKYGVNAFELSIIEDNLSFEASVKLEAEMIEKYNTTDERYGYNILKQEPGEGPMPQSTKDAISASRKGQATSVKKGDKFDEERKKKISDAQIGKPMLEEHYKNFCDAMAKRRGQPTTHMPTEEEIKHLSEIHKQQVAIKETGEIFESLTECSKAKGISIEYLSRKIKEGKPWKGLTFYKVYVNA